MYIEQSVSTFQGNPMIEALPKLPTNDDEVIRQLFVMPNIRSSDKDLNKYERIMLLPEIKNYFFPFDRVLKLNACIESMMRNAYVARNPLSAEWKQTINRENSISDYSDNRQIEVLTPTHCAAIIGVSGCGKTTAINRIMAQYPRVIIHREYKGAHFTQTQIPYIKVDAPHNGSYVTFCNSVFEEIDRYADSNTQDRYGATTNNPANMIHSMRRMLLLYNVGILIVDEVQYLLNSNKDPDEIMAFFVSLANQLGVPIVFVGTPKAQELFDGSLATARRASMDGFFNFSPFAKDDEEWVAMLNGLFPRCILHNSVDISSEMVNAFYDCSQGVLGLATVLFSLTQRNALIAGEERITPKAVYETFESDMGMVKPMVSALKSKNYIELAKYEDLYVKLDTRAIMDTTKMKIRESQTNEMQRQHENIPSVQREKHELLGLKLRGLGLCANWPVGEMDAAIAKIIDDNPLITAEEALIPLVLSAYTDRNKRKKTKHKTDAGEFKRGSLLSIYRTALEDNQHPYELLKQYGYIKPISHDFPDVS